MTNLHTALLCCSLSPDVGKGLYTLILTQRWANLRASADERWPPKNKINSFHRIAGLAPDTTRDDSSKTCQEEEASEKAVGWGAGGGREVREGGGLGTSAWTVCLSRWMK